MSATERILNRFPRFYNLDIDSKLFCLCNGFGLQIEEAKKDLFIIMKSHWIAGSIEKDLDKIASMVSFFRGPGQIDLDFKNELLKFINFCLSNPGGGTIKALIEWMSLFLGLDYNLDRSYSNGKSSSLDLEIIENPESDEKIDLEATNDSMWEVDSMSIRDEKFSMTISVEGNDREVLFPEVVLDSESSIKYNSALRSGQKLVIRESGHAEVDGVNVTSSMVIRGDQMISRKPSMWTYKENTSPKVGRFDQAKFDENYYQVDVPKISISIEWRAKLRATLEIIISSAILAKKGISTEKIQWLLNQYYKAVGVNVIVKSRGDE